MKSNRVIWGSVIAIILLAVAVVHDRMMRDRINAWKTLATTGAPSEITARLSKAEIVESFGMFMVEFDGHAFPGPFDWSRCVRWGWPPVRLPKRQKLMVLTNHGTQQVVGMVLVGSTLTQVMPIDAEQDTELGRMRVNIDFSTDASGQVKADIEVKPAPRSDEQGTSSDE